MGSVNREGADAGSIPRRLHYRFQAENRSRRSLHPASNRKRRSERRTLGCADVLVQELDLEALLLRFELDDVSDRDDAHYLALVVDDR
jgi:hypothetical protein